MVCKIELLIEFQNNLKHENYSDSKIDVWDAGWFLFSSCPNFEKMFIKRRSLKAYIFMGIGHCLKRT